MTHVRSRLICILLLATVAWLTAPRPAPASEPISLSAFRDGIKHWKNGQNSDGYPVYRPDQVTQIADNLLRYQRANGGWPPNFDPLRKLDDAEVQKLAAERKRLDTSFDNRASYPEVEYLAAAYAQTGDNRYRRAAERGIEFMLEAQYDNGGWPHSYPNQSTYRPHITIVDDVMTGVLGTLRKIAEGQRPFEFVEPALRAAWPSPSRAARPACSNCKSRSTASRPVGLRSTIARRWPRSWAARSNCRPW